MKYPAKHWPDHPAIGRHISVNGNQVEILDVKAGPMTADLSDTTAKDFTLRGTLKLRVLMTDGSAVWLPPLDGQGLLDHLGIENAPSPEA